MEEALKHRRREFMELMMRGMAEDEVETLYARLDDIGFFTAPASTKYHGAYSGGLHDHSYLVTKNLLHLTESLGLSWEKKRSPYIVGMLHDICKCHMYIANDTGFEYNRDLYLPGHGGRSVILAQRLVRLTEEEILCIRWHMGAFDNKENWNAYGCAIENFPNVLWTHTADMMASHIDQV